ncbi:hypothetical protein HQ545_07955 [Candidatus Woesearchaeota archaeon]|nr:hypothetical protein [Candidatus Woesearchaeota archaeon]
MVLETDYEVEALYDKEDVCKQCINWKEFKEKCWYFWEQKKECSQRVNL